MASFYEVIPDDYRERASEADKHQTVHVKGGYGCFWVLECMVLAGNFALIPVLFP